MADLKSSRRTFLKALGAAGAAGLATGCKTGYYKEPDVEPGEYVCGEGPTVVRKDVTTLASDDPILEAYRTAIQKMKALPAADPQSWQAQANIHFDHCPHSNWFFLPWHRAYLAYFERIIREQSGMKDWALPYWNWTEAPQIPAPFWSGDLNDPTRSATPASTANSAFVGPAVIQQILNTSNFQDFGSFASTTQRGGAGYGILEGTPHNYIHGFVGGNMSTFHSPLDPIFWLHHCNVDRLWVEWIEAGHSNSANNSWLDFVFPQNFFDPCTDAEVDVEVSQTLTTLGYGYRYDTQSAMLARGAEMARAAAREPVAETLLTAAVDGATSAGRPLSVTLGAAAAMSQHASALRSAMEAPDASSLRLGILGIDAPDPRQQTTGVRVFVNCPYLDESTPINDPHYVGSFTFFEHEHVEGHGDHEMGKERSFYLDVDSTLQKLQRIRGYDPGNDELQIQLLAVPLRDKVESATIQPERISLARVS